jgi:hypothetical protein
MMCHDSNYGLYEHISGRIIQVVIYLYVNEPHEAWINSIRLERKGERGVGRSKATAVSQAFSNGRVHSPPAQNRGFAIKE